MKVNNITFATDAKLMLPIFQSELRDISKVSKIYVTRMYQRDHALLIQYHVYFEGSDNFQIYYGKHFDKSDELKSSTAKIDDEHYFSIPERNLIVFRYPYDPALKMLSKICSKQNETDDILSLLELYAEESDIKIHKRQLLGYRFERRAVIRMTFDNEVTLNGSKVDSLIMKMSKPSKSKRMHSNARLMERSLSSVCDNVRFDTAKVYGYSEPMGIVLMEDVPGKTLHDCLGENCYTLGCEQAARLLKLLHNIPGNDFQEFTKTDELAILSKQIDMIERGVGKDSKLFNEAYSILTNASEAVDESKSKNCIHRDFYDKQLIYNTNRIALIDVDNLANGDPAIDCGNFIAHLYLRIFQTPEHAVQLFKAIEIFNKTYITDDLSEVRLNWWRAASLLRLACIYFVRPRWQKLSIHLLRKSISCLKG